MKTWCQLAGSENYFLRLSERDAKEGVTTPPRLQLADELDAPFMTEQHFWLVSIAWTVQLSCTCIQQKSAVQLKYFIALYPECRVTAGMVVTTSNFSLSGDRYSPTCVTFCMQKKAGTKMACFCNLPQTWS